MIFVVVLSVYLYRSTTPEWGHLDRPQPAPRVSETSDGPAKKQVTTGKEIKPQSKQMERKAVHPTEKAPDQPTQKAFELSAPGGRDSAPGIEPGDAGIPPVLAEKGAASDHALKKGSVSREAAPPPSPAKTERYKTRGMAVEEKSSGYQMTTADVSQETSSRITVTAHDPSDVARKARRIMTSLAAGEIRERTEDDSVIITCLIDPKSIRELKNKIAEIAPVIESRTRIMAGQTVPQFTEIIILKDSRSNP